MAGISVMATAAPASALKSEQERFKVEVFAEQHSDWTTDRTFESDCGQATFRQHGGGGQSFSLTTKKPFKITAVRTKIQGDSFLTFYSGKPEAPKLGIPVNVAAIREGSLTTEQLSGSPDAGCGDGGGDGTPPAPDCGSRNFNAEVRLQFYEPEDYPGDPAPLSSVLSLEGPLDADGGFPLNRQWSNCAGPGNDSGDLMETPTGALAANKLFGKKKKFSVKAKDTENYSRDGFNQTTRLNWTVDFNRLRK